jgi:hypothetical protein
MEVSIVRCRLTLAVIALSPGAGYFALSHENRERATENWSAFGEDAEWGGLRETAAPTGQIKITSPFVPPSAFSAVK